jgi:hypothetical protein
MSTTPTAHAPAERDVLERLGNAIWIATLTMVASLGVVTALAAFAAGLRAMEGAGDPSRAPAREFWATFRVTWRRSLPFLAGAVAVAGVASVDLVVAPSLPRWLPAVVATAGMLLAFGLLQLWPYTAMELADRAEHEHREPAGAVLRAAAARAGRHPGLAAGVGVLGALVAVAIVAVPALSPVAMGVHLAVCAGVLARTRAPCPSSSAPVSRHRSTRKP